MAQDAAKSVNGKAEASSGFRYIQLPINAAMPEAWRDRTQALSESDSRLQSTMAVAKALGIGVFASGPLMEGELPGSSSAKAYGPVALLYRL